MKKLLLILLPLAFYGCKKQPVPQIKSIYYTVQPTDWKLSSSQSFWYANIPDADITQDILDNGAISCYIVGTTSAGAEYLEQLPFTFQATGHTYIDFYNVGFAEVQYANGSTLYPQLPAEKYKIVVISEK